jgi:uncharacterized protein YkwD
MDNFCKFEKNIPTMAKLLITPILLLMLIQVAAQTGLDEERMLNLVNAARSQDCCCGDVEKTAVPPLTWDKALEKAARIHANDMSRKDFFSHTGSDKSTVSQRVDRVKFKWRAVGENIAKGQMDEATVVKGWMDSPGHCKNIMNPNFKYMGVALSSDGMYWVQVFADKITDDGNYK